MTKKPLIRYEKWYSKQYTKDQEIKNIKKVKLKNKEAKMLEIFEKLDNDRMELGLSVENRLKLNEEKREKFKMDNSKKIRQKSLDMHQKYLKLLENKSNKNKERHEQGLEVLERQHVSMTRAKTIENFNFESKSTLYEKNIIDQIDYEKRMLIFAKKLRECKSNSLMKKALKIDSNYIYK